MRHKTIPPNFLDSRPLRREGLAWRIKEDGTAELDIAHRGFYNAIAQKFFKKPPVSHIALDRYGSVLWQSIDGENTVADIVELMKERFPDEADRMLDRVVTFLAMLHRNRFITLQKAST